MTTATAVELDRQGSFEEAALEHERALMAGDRSLHTLVNLALLYWQATDAGIAASAHLPAEFMAKAATRYPVLLEEAKVRFPASTLARFWAAYIAWTELGDPISAAMCRDLMREDGSELTPALYVFIESRGRQAEPEAMALLRASKAAGTAGARYVASLLEAAVRDPRSKDT